jgi:MYXO-CTERM domain-containing protein
MKTIPGGVVATLVLAASALFFARPARADVTLPTASEPWVLDDNCHAEGLLPGEVRCFSKRWVPESVAAQRLAQAHARLAARMKGDPFASACDGQKQTAYSPTLTPASMGAKDLATAYLLPTGAPTGAGKIVAVVDACGYSDVVKELNAYRAQYGIAPITQCGGGAGHAPTKGGAQCIGVVSQKGTATLPPDDSGWAGETALDVQMVSAACPDCSILVVQATSASGTNLDAAVAEAVKLGADAVSNSWGHTESGADAQLPATPGTLIAAASGDADYLNQIGAIDEDAGTVVYSPSAPNWPASDPNVLSVGGTTLTMDATSSRCYSDSAWSFMVPATSPSPLHGKTVYGGGSGCSTDYATPSYQSGLAMGSCKKRGSVDVSAAADFSPGDYKAGICVKGQPCGGIAVYGGGGWNPSVGTSASTPFVSAVLVRMGLAAKANSYFYQNPTAFQDVTTGNNDPSATCNDVMCNAGVGWDGPTGWGAPNGYEMAVLGGAAGVVKPPSPVCAALPVGDGGVPEGGADASSPGHDSGSVDPGSDSGTPASSTGDPGSSGSSGGTSGVASGGSDSGAINQDAPTDSASTGGCGCTTVGSDAPSPLLPTGALAAIGAIVARARRRRR